MIHVLYHTNIYLQPGIMTSGHLKIEMLAWRDMISLSTGYDKSSKTNKNTLPLMVEFVTISLDKWD